MSKVVDPRDTKVLFVPFGGVLENQYRLNYLGRVGDLEFAGVALEAVGYDLESEIS